MHATMAAIGRAHAPSASSFASSASSPNDFTAAICSTRGLNSNDENNNNNDKRLNKFVLASTSAMRDETCKAARRVHQTQRRASRCSQPTRCLQSEISNNKTIKSNARTTHTYTYKTHNRHRIPPTPEQSIWDRATRYRLRCVVDARLGLDKRAPTRHDSTLQRKNY